ncbi:MAG: hypothetical protein HHJ11_11755 [Phycicoccus sp.]|nr:hypothetical protein [Phycicoccus sp.]NMM34202.1 hypothetical protein [Phycicoccus sp.]
MGARGVRPSDPRHVVADGDRRHHDQQLSRYADPSGLDGAVDGLLGIRPLVTVTLAADHRATDAAIGPRLLKTIDRILQTPEET